MIFPSLIGQSVDPLLKFGYQNGFGTRTRRTHVREGCEYWSMVCAVGSGSISKIVPITIDTFADTDSKLAKKLSGWSIVFGNLIGPIQLFTQYEMRSLACQASR
jgi:uncharacterized membrane protein YedE/YeeE